MPLDFTPLTQLVELLRVAGLRADTDPAKLNPPCAWVTVGQLDTLTLDGRLQIAAQVYLIAPDADYTRSLAALEELYDKLETVLQPDGPVFPRGVILPDTPAPLPGLLVPVNL